MIIVKTRGEWNNVSCLLVKVYSVAKSTYVITSLIYVLILYSLPDKSYELQHN